MKSQYIIIIGCGSLGAILANRLSTLGHSIVVIDQNPASFDALGSEFSGFKIDGDANEYIVLRQAKVDKADIVLAITNDDNLNIMISQICTHIYKIKQVIARVNKPQSAEIFAKLGIQTVCPTLLATDKLVHAIEASSSKERA